jgi:predicted NBD/HSP70 family sugar kinase
MPPAKPSLQLLRSLSDENVLTALMDARQLTRAELAGRTGISKPTVSESVRRLSQAGLLTDTGMRTTGRGGVGSYYSLTEGLGSALVVSIAPQGIVAEILDVYGDISVRQTEHVPPSPGRARVATALGAVAQRVQAASSAPLRLAVVSAADPVDRATGRLLELPDAPFLIGELAAADELGPLVTGPVVVDNDVHWAARAEHHAAGSDTSDDFAYLYLGDGLGCAVVADGDVRRGHHGIAGEVAHLITRGPHGSAVQFTEVFAALGLRRAGSTAIDSGALLDVLDARGARGERVRTVLSDAICGVLTALVTISDPKLVVIGGVWGLHPALLARLDIDFRGCPRHVPVRAAVISDEPALTGARERALQELRAAILGDARPAAG